MFIQSSPLFFSGFAQQLQILEGASAKRHNCDANCPSPDQDDEEGTPRTRANEEGGCGPGSRRTAPDAGVIFFEF